MDFITKNNKLPEHQPNFQLELSLSWQAIGTFPACSRSFLTSLLGALGLRYLQFWSESSAFPTEVKP